MAMTKICKKSVQKVEPADTSQKIDELLDKAKCVVSGAEERPMGMKVRCPAWMEEYAARHPNVDFSRCPLDFWRGANNFLFKSFYRAYEERDGDLLKNPAIAEASSPSSSRHSSSRTRPSGWRHSRASSKAWRAGSRSLRTQGRRSRSTTPGSRSSRAQTVPTQQVRFVFARARRVTVRSSTSCANAIPR